MRETGKIDRRALQETSKHLEAFEAWYARGRNGDQTAAALGCNHETIRRWARAFDWHARADERDAQFKEQAQKTALERNGELVKRHNEACDVLISKGVEHLLHNPIDNARDAITAVRYGIELQRRTMELPDFVVKLLTGSDEALIERARELVEELQRSRGLTPGGEEDPLDVDFSHEDPVLRALPPAGEEVEA
jgi:hypothetical protein